MPALVLEPEPAWGRRPREAKRKVAGPNQRNSAALHSLPRVALFLDAPTPAVCSYFIPRSVRTLGFSSPIAKT